MKAKVALFSSLLLFLFSENIFSYDLYQDYLAFSGHVGFPSGYDLQVGYSTRDVRLNLSGMFAFPYYEIQSSFDFRLFNETSFENGPGIFGGYIKRSVTTQEIKNGRLAGNT